MTDDPKSIATLRKFARSSFALIDSDSLQSELQGTSDRAVVIVLAAIIDDLLEFLISKKMRRMSDESEYLEAFKNDGPMGSFSARINFAYWFEAIDLPLRQRFHELREMRNACAHSKRPISFENPELANVAKRFLRGATFPIPADNPKGIRAAMIAECFWLFNVLATSEEEARKNLQDVVRSKIAERDASQSRPPERSPSDDPQK